MTIEELVLHKLRKLPHDRQEEVLKYVNYLEYTQEYRPTVHFAEKSDLSLREAAKALLADYETDKELTAFTALDSEAFHA